MFSVSERRQAPAHNIGDPFEWTVHMLNRPLLNPPTDVFSANHEFLMTLPRTCRDTTGSPRQVSLMTMGRCLHDKQAPSSPLSGMHNTLIQTVTISAGTRRTATNGIITGKPSAAADPRHQASQHGSHVTNHQQAS